MLHRVARKQLSSALDQRVVLPAATMRPPETSCDASCCRLPSAGQCRGRGGSSERVCAGGCVRISPCTACLRADAPQGSAGSLCARQSCSRCMLLHLWGYTCGSCPWEFMFACAQAPASLPPASSASSPTQPAVRLLNDSTGLNGGQVASMWGSAHSPQNTWSAVRLQKPAPAAPAAAQCDRPGKR